ncbi:MAG: rRNA pseudouridine synthase [Lachnospiraceae bacterium]|nr:rRNA pseudouridine synthase [Lachnospiraceae bacterium]
MRLDKLLVEMQIGSRSEVKKYIKNGLVTVDGTNKVKPEQQIDPFEQKITFKGKEITYQEYEYYMLYKPADCVTARTDALHKTVMEYIESKRKDLSPVGRLDIDTEGLLLITNDGKLSHNLLSPTKHVKKVYEADIEGCVTKEDCFAFANGLDIGDDTLTKPAELEIIESGEFSKIRITITEGRYHQVKRMFQAVGKKVVFLKRLEMGSLCLDKDLKPGEYRSLTKQEIMNLQEDDYAYEHKRRNF